MLRFIIFEKKKKKPFIPVQITHKLYFNVNQSTFCRKRIFVIDLGRGYIGRLAEIIYLNKVLNEQNVNFQVRHPIVFHRTIKYRVRQRIGRFLSVKKIKSIGCHETTTFIRMYIL